jgi:hypothetical protein
LLLASNIIMAAVGTELGGESMGDPMIMSGSLWSPDALKSIK